MAYPFKNNPTQKINPIRINKKPTRIEINPTQLKNQPNPKIKLNFSLLPLHCGTLHLA